MIDLREQESEGEGAAEVAALTGDGARTDRLVEAEVDSGGLE